MSKFLKQTGEVFACYDSMWVTARAGGWTPCSRRCGYYRVKDLPEWAVAQLIAEDKAVVKVRKVD